jgi:VanZ family protein
LITKIAFWSACIFFGFLCLIPTAYLPSGLFNWWDKAQHVIAFFCLYSFGVLAYQKALGKVAIGLLLYGGSIEILQWFTGWRSGELSDWLADGIGILIGFALASNVNQKARSF